jgi:hypothetical protein
MMTLVVVATAVRGGGSACAQSRCVSAKFEAVGRSEAGLLSCLARVAARGRATNLGRCVSKVKGRLTRSFSTAGECSGDDSICNCLAENCAVDVRLSLPDAGPSRCESARLRAVARKVTGTLRCNAQAVADGKAVDEGCIRKVQARYQAAFAKTKGCTGDGAAVGTMVETACVTEVGANPTAGSMVGDPCTSHACDDDD